MTYKRTPTDDEIDALAEQFRPLWRTGEAVRPWLRKHASMLIDLVHDDWSWAGVAIALDRAGVAYKTGNPWQAEQLRAKIAGTRRPLKRDAWSAAIERDLDRSEIDRNEIVCVPAVDSKIPHALITAVGPEIRDEEPEFKFAKLANWSGNTSPPARQVQAKEPAERLSVSDVDAIVARLTGGKSS
jgi:hypothetical protein